MTEETKKTAWWERLAAYWRAEPARSVPWLETLGLSIGAPALAAGLHASDPLLISAGFPWSALIPLLIGLRHGLYCSLASTAILGVVALAAWQFAAQADAAFPSAYLAGMMGVSLITSEYRGHWHRNLDRLTGSEHYHRVRLEQFAKSYHVLKTSHDNLEQQVCASTRSLRGALSDLQKRVLTIETERSVPFRGAAGSIIQLFADYGMLQMAALWEVGENGALAKEPAARLGAPRPMRRDDPILLEALGRKRAVALSPGHDPHVTGMLAAIPIVDVDGRIHGVVTVDELPFVAVQSANLNLLSVLGGYVADCLNRWPGVAGSGPVPEFEGFQAAVRRAVLDARNCQVPGMLVVLSLSPEYAQPEFVEKVVLNCRGLDHVWVSRDRHDGVVIAKLMPCTDQVGAERYIWRLDRMLKTQWGVSLSADGIGIAIESINGAASVDQVLGKFKKILRPTRSAAGNLALRSEAGLAPRGSKCSSYS